MRLRALLFVMIICALLPGCRRISVQNVSVSDEDREVQEIVDAIEHAETVPVYGNVLAYDSAISVIIEGYSTDEEMMAIADLIKEYDADVTMFIPGEEAINNPDIITYIDGEGVDIGSYGLNGEAEMELNKTEKNARQIYLSQKAFTTAGIQATDYLRLNLTEYTDEILKIAEVCGFSAVIEPNVFLNHRSFQDIEPVDYYVSSIPRGSIVTIKVGQELDESEIETPAIYDEDPADDYQPTIEEIEPSEPVQNDVDIVTITEWILSACETQGREIVPLDTLQENSKAPAPEFEVPSELLAQLDIALYPNNTTEQPFGLQESERVSDSYFNNTVFVGDSVTASLMNYVNNERLSTPNLLGNAQFLAGVSLSARNALWEVSDDSKHPTYNGQKMLIEDAISQMDVDKVYLMLGMNDIQTSGTEVSDNQIETYLENYQLLISLIKEKSPNVEIYIQSLTPGTVQEEVLEPNNVQIMQFNLALVEFCAKYGYNFVDVAYDIRDERGALPKEWCSDPDGVGVHLNEIGADVWIEYLYTHTK